MPAADTSGDPAGTPNGELRAVHARIAERLALLIPAPAQEDPARAPSPYVRRYLADHAAEGEVLENTVTPRVVHWLDVSRLRAVATPQTLPLMALVRRAAYSWTSAHPQRNAAALQFLAAAESRTGYQFGTAWGVDWAKSPGASEILAIDGVALIDVVAMPTGHVLVMTAGITTLVHDLAHGEAVPVPRGAENLTAAILVPASSPGRLYVVTGYEDGTLRSCPVSMDRRGRLRQPEPGQEKAFYGGAEVTALVRSPAGPGEVLIGRKNGAVSLRHLEGTGGSRPIPSAASNRPVVGIAVLASDQPRGLSITMDGRLRSWPLPGDRHDEVSEYLDLAGTPRALAATRLGDRSAICIVADDGGHGPPSLQIVRLPLTRGARLLVDSDDADVRAIAAWTSPGDRSMAVTGDAQGRLRLVDLDQARVVSNPVEAHAGGVRGLVSAGPPGGPAVLISVGHDGVARSWDLRELLPSSSPKFGGGRTPPRSVDPPAGPAVRMWRLRDGQELGHALPTHTHRFAGVVLAELANGSTVAVTVDSRRPGRNSFGEPLVSAVMMGQGHAVAVTAADDVLRLWDLTPGEDADPPIPRPGFVLEHPGVHALATAAIGDGRSFAASGGRDGVRIWDLDDRTLTNQPPEAVEALTAVTVGPAQFFVGACSDTYLRVWDAVTGVEQRDLQGFDRKHRHRVSALGAVHLEGRLLVVTAQRGNGYIRRWVLDGVPDNVQELATYDAAITALAVASGVKPAVIVALADRTVRILDLYSGEPLVQEPLPVPGTVRSITCLPGGAGALIAGDDVFALLRWPRITKGR